MAGNTYKAFDGTEQYYKAPYGDGSSGDPYAQAVVVHAADKTEPLGSVSDAMVEGDSPGTISAKLRGLLNWVKWRMPASIGQKTKSGSLAVTLASDEDMIHAAGATQNSGDKGILALAVRKDTPLAGGADGEYVRLNVDNLGRLWVNIDKILDQGSMGQQAKTGSLPVVPASDWKLPDTAAGDLASIAASLSAIEGAQACAYTHTAPAVTTSSNTVLAANANRQYVLLVNDSDTTIYVKFGSAAVVNEGIRIAAGGSFEASKLLGNLSTAAIHAIHGGSGNKTLLITEGA